MSTYTVTYSTAVEADSPLAAASLAWWSATDPQGQYPILTVTDDEGRAVDVDLDEVSR